MLALIIVLSMTGQTSDPATAGVNDRNTLKALADLFDENRSKFISGRVWFEYTDGFAKTVDDAVRGNLTDAYKAEGFYAFQGNKAIYSCEFPDNSLIATSNKIAETQVSHRFQSVRSLTDGKVTLLDTVAGDPDGKTTRGVMIHPGIQDFYRGAHIIPLNLGFPESSRQDFSRSARLILDGSSGLTLVKVDDGTAGEATKSVRIEVKGPSGLSTIWVDPERASIPIRAHEEMPTGNYDISLGDIREVSGRGWLPFEQTEFMVGGRVIRIRLTKVDFGTVPDDTFRLEFPEPIAMLNGEKNLSYAPQKIWDLSRLPSAKASGTTRVEPFVAIEPTMPSERESRPPYFTLGAMGMIAVLAIVGLWWWRTAGAATK